MLCYGNALWSCNCSLHLAMRILVLAQKGDWTGCESALKALERSVEEGATKQPLAGISDNVRKILLLGNKPDIILKSYSFF